MNNSNLIQSRNKGLFSEQMRIVDLINLNYNLIGTLHRMNIGLDVCEQSVKQACGQYGVDSATFILICNVYSYEHYKPSLTAIEQANAKDIVKYLHNSHSYYLDNAISSLEVKIEDLLSNCTENKKKILWKFFTDYKNELKYHFDYEEKVVFPYVEKVLEGTNTDKTYSMAKYKDNHSNIDEKLSDLKNLVMRYLPIECSEDKKKDVLFHIYYLEDDLERHTSIEEDILMPLVNIMENNG